MHLSPPSSRAAFANTPAFFDGTIAPLIARAEQRRRRAVRDAGLIAAAGAAVVAVFLVIGGDGGVIAAMVAGLIAVGVAGARLNRTRGEITDAIIGRFAGHLGFDYARSPGRPFYTEPFSRFGLLPRFNRERWEDEIAGAHDGVRFSLIEAHLKYRSGGRKKRTRTVFHGQLIVIDYPRPFAGTTIIKRDASVLNGLGRPGKAFRRVGLVSSKFEKAFEAWSTDQVEARALLDPVMLERFAELERLFDGAKLRVAFADAKLYIALENGDRLSIGTMFRPIDGAARADRLLKEFDLIFDLIDVAARRANAPLDGVLSVGDVRAG